MMNLFSSFDPSSSSFSLSWDWFCLLLPLYFFFMVYWGVSSRKVYVLKILFDLLSLELKVVLGSMHSYILKVLFFSIFYFIGVSNFLGLFPYIFTSGSHLSISLGLACPFWLTFVFYNWVVFTNSSFGHLVPQSTPVFLMSFMVLIESISYLIRPFTLSIRLSANLIAGHLLLTLLGNLSVNLGLVFKFLNLGLQFMLLILETSVSLIQAYVFVILLTLYSSEVSH